MGGLSAILSFLIMIFMHFYWNDSPTFGYGDKIIKFMSMTKELFIDRQPVENVIAINVSYDRMTAPYYAPNEEYLGVVDMTDRKKLNDFLNMLKERDAYSYIVCDINFSDPQLKSEYDEELFATIASMRDIIVASSDLNKDPEQIKEKTVLSKYKINSAGDGFFKYDFMIDGKPSMALKMWLDMENGTYEEYWWGAKMNGKSCFQTIVPDFKFAIYSDVNAADSSVTMQNMGNALQYYKISPSYARFYDGKIVLIGAWKNNDIHDTIIGQQPGIVITYNAFLALYNKDNSMPFWVCILTFIVTWLECMFIFRSSFTPKLSRHIKNKLRILLRIKITFHKLAKKYPFSWFFIEVLLSFVTFTTPLGVLMFVVYFTTGVFVNLIIIGFILWCVSHCNKKFKFVV